VPREAKMMEFTITCPVDGLITVSLEDIDTVVLREPERAEIGFVCPECGTLITVQAVIPSFLLAAIEALAEEGDGNVPVSGIVALVNEVERTEEAPAPTPAVSEDDPVVDAYCEYFRRQLDDVASVEDALAEIDEGP
jgi:hypothetical protein